MNEKELDEYLNRYKLIIEWTNNVIHDVIETDRPPTTESFAGNSINMLIVEVCGLSGQRPLTVIDLKPWIDQTG